MRKHKTPTISPPETEFLQETRFLSAPTNPRPPTPRQPPQKPSFSKKLGFYLPPTNRLPHCAISPPHCAISLPHCAISLPHCAISLPHCAISPPHCAISPPHCAISPPHYAISPPHCAIKCITQVPIRNLGCVTGNANRNRIGVSAHSEHTSLSERHRTACTRLTLRVHPHVFGGSAPCARRTHLRRQRSAHALSINRRPH